MDKSTSNTQIKEPANNNLSEEKIEALLAALNKSNKLVSKDLTFRQNIIKGIYSGLGATLGIAILFALASFIIKILGGLPFVGSELLRLGTYLHK